MLDVHEVKALAQRISAPSAVTSLALTGTVSYSIIAGGYFLIAASGETWQDSLALGGPAGAIWAWLVFRALILLPTLAASELVSAFPMSNGPYAWVGCLLALRSGWDLGGAGSRFLSFISAALLSLAFIATDARVASSCAWNISAIARYSSWVDGEGLPPTSSEGLSQGASVGVAMAILCAWGLLHTMHIRSLGRVFVVATAASVVFVLGFSIALLMSTATYSPATGVAGPSAGWAFTKGYNGIGVDTPDASRYATVMGLSVVAAFTYYAAPVFVSEETLEARTTVPHAMIIEFMTTSILGFIFVIAAASATPAILLQPYSTWVAGVGAGGSVSAYLDAAIAAVIQSSDGSQIVFAALGRSAGMAFLIIQLILRFTIGVAFMTMPIRLTYALFRDHAYPFARALRSKSAAGAPLGAIACVVTAELLLILLGLVTEPGERAIMRISACCLYAAFAMPFLFRVIFARDTFSPGPWSLGRWSVPTHAGAFLSVTFFALLQVFPTELPATVDNANWTVVFLVGFLLLACVWWAVYAHAHFVPPREWAGAMLAYQRGLTIQRFDSSLVEGGSAEETEELAPRLQAFLDDHAPELLQPPAKK